jgi:hypothetical protein
MRRTQFQPHRDASCLQVFFLQGKASKEIQAILTGKLGKNEPLNNTIKNGWPILNVVIFPPAMRLNLNDPKQ